jgi:hypothetical protein
VHRLRLPEVSSPSRLKPKASPPPQKAAASQPARQPPPVIPSREPAGAIAAEPRADAFHPVKSALDHLRGRVSQWVSASAIGLSVVNGISTAQAAPDPQRMGWVSDEPGAATAARLNKMHVEAAPAFARLAPEDRLAALAVLSKNPADQSLAEQIVSLSSADGFPQLGGAVRAAAWQALARLADAPAGRQTVVSWVTQPALPSLPSADQARSVAVVAAYAATGEGLAPVEQTLSSPAFAALDAPSRAHLLDLLERTSQLPAFAGDVPRILAEPAFQQLAPTARALVLDVAARMAREGATPQDLPLLRIALQRIGPEKLPAVLAQAARLAQVPAALVSPLVQELANPSRFVNQGDRGTCTVTSMTYRLALQNPAEYARLVTDLVLTGKAVLANGAVITPPADARAEDNSGRSPPERLLQSALMAYGSAPQAYSNADRERGLPYEAMVKVATALYGVRYVSSENGAYEALVLALNRGEAPVLVALAWDGGEHAVEVTQIQDGKVYVHNPWGAQDVGGYLLVGGPERQAVNPADTIDTMTTDAFFSALRATFTAAR